MRINGRDVNPLIPKTWPLWYKVTYGISMIIMVIVVLALLIAEEVTRKEQAGNVTVAGGNQTNKTHSKPRCSTHTDE